MTSSKDTFRIHQERLQQTCNDFELPQDSEIVLLKHSLFFPPKQAIGNRSSQTLEYRRSTLERYLRMVVNLSMNDPRSPLHARPCRETLLDALPFFCEDTISMDAVVIE